MTNSQTAMDLDTAVREVLALLTGLDLEYDPDMDRYRTIARNINRAQRSIAVEKEWSYYASVRAIGMAVEGMNYILLEDNDRPRIVGDDQLRLTDALGRPWRWAAFLPRDALHKYADRDGLWVAVTRNLIQFSRPFNAGEAGLRIELPIMREPVNFVLPSQPETPIDPAVRTQLVDFAYPDLVVLRAAYFYAQTDPVTQPRVQTLDAQYKDLMYQLITRDDSISDTPFLNDFFVPVQNGIYPESSARMHPIADERR